MLAACKDFWGLAYSKGQTQTLNVENQITQETVNLILQNCPWGPIFG